MDWLLIYIFHEINLWPWDPEATLQILSLCIGKISKLKINYLKIKILTFIVCLKCTFLFLFSSSQISHSHFSNLNVIDAIRRAWGKWESLENRQRNINLRIFVTKLEFFSRAKRMFYLIKFQKGIDKSLEVWNFDRKAW